MHLEISSVLRKAKELGFSMPEQHLPPKSSLSSDTCSSVNGAKKAPGASKFQSNDLRNKGTGCCSEGGAGRWIQLLC